MSWANPANWSEEAQAERKAKRSARNRRYTATHKRVARSQHIAPFVACDGEGAGVDQHGRQVYRLFRMGERELYLGGEPLETEEILEFILEAPANVILVGYYFTYDATMALRDLSRSRLEYLLDKPGVRGERQDPNEFASSYTWWRDYAIDWRPGSYFRVARLDRTAFRVVKGTSRTINEVSGYFRQTLLETAIKFGAITDDEREFVAAMKEARRDFTHIGEPERKYCQLECRLLGSIMQTLRMDCVSSGVIPQHWRGPGYLAAVLHRRHNTPRRDALPARPAALDLMASDAFMGGRFEAVRIGRVAERVIEADLNSTYAAVLPTLPCALHTRWRPIRNLEKCLADNRLFCARVVFDHPRPVRLCGLPVRSKGRLLWPARGGGTYFSVELAPALRAGAVLRDFRGGYEAVKQCDCRPFDWCAELYDRRLELGKDGKGYPLKIALAALYGKFVQKLGSAPWRDLLAAGITTATVRGWLIDAYRGREDDVVMLASDAVYSVGEPLPLPYGDQLGQWEPVERPDLFVVQPGLYWSTGAGVAKTRGLPQSAVIERATDFEAAWRHWLDTQCDGPIPRIPIRTEMFTSHRMAMGFGNMRLAGRWRPLVSRVSFAWAAKRHKTFRLSADGAAALTTPIRGNYSLWSEPYDPSALTEFERRQREDEASPDFVPWGNTGE